MSMNAWYAYLDDFAGLNLSPITGGFNQVDFYTAWNGDILQQLNQIGLSGIGARYAHPRRGHGIPLVVYQSPRFTNVIHPIPTEGGPVPLSAHQSRRFTNITHPVPTEGMSGVPAGWA